MNDANTHGQLCMCDACIDARTKVMVEQRERNMLPPMTDYEKRRGGRVPEPSRVRRDDFEG